MSGTSPTETLTTTPPSATQDATEIEVEEYDLSWDESDCDCEDLLDDFSVSCLEKERSFFQHWKRPLDRPRASSKNKKEKITRRFISVRAQRKEDLRIMNLPTPPPIPPFVPRYAPAPVTPVVTSTYTPPPYVPPPVQKEVSTYEKDIQSAIRASLNQSHESGLSYRQLNDLLNRDLTPEDYELLLLLDTTLAKKTTDDNTLKSLDEFTAADDHCSESCMICVCEYEKDEKITRLPCNHLFHSDCVGIWLREHSQACPLCNANVAC